MPTLRHVVRRDYREYPEEDMPSPPEPKRSRTVTKPLRFVTEGAGALPYIVSGDVRMLKAYLDSRCSTHKLVEAVVNEAPLDVRAEMITLLLDHGCSMFAHLDPQSLKPGIHQPTPFYLPFYVMGLCLSRSGLANAKYIDILVVLIEHMRHAHMSNEEVLVTPASLACFLTHCIKLCDHSVMRAVVNNPFFDCLMTTNENLFCERVNSFVVHSPPRMRDFIHKTGYSFGKKDDCFDNFRDSTSALLIPSLYFHTSTYKRYSGVTMAGKKTLLDKTKHKDRLFFCHLLDEDELLPLLRVDLPA